ncbi:MAG: O-methyltransferase [Hyphomonadaceae bacterium]|nr:O-methyltransferase [Hyphomonadaceae bacterium]
MSGSIFEDVDHYIDSLFTPDEDVLSDVLQRAAAAGLPDIHISPGQGKFLYLLAKMSRAKRILELGTLAGYSTIWLGRAMPEDGELTTIEIDPVHADVARGSLKAAGLEASCEVVVGSALDVLPGLTGPFDLIFIDANKESYPAYLTHAVRLTRPGGLILADNVVRRGAVLGNSMDPAVIGAKAFNQALASHPQLEAIVLQQVGRKGHDGLAIARVKDAG